MQAVSSIPFAHRAVDPTDQLAIVDALYRFGAGQDLSDRALFESAFAHDATSNTYSDIVFTSSSLSK